MRNLVTVALAFALMGGTAGCEAKSSDVAPGDAKAPAAPAHPQPAPAADKGAEKKAADTKPAPSSAEENLTQDTAEGAAKLFVRAMKAGDFESVVLVVDPTSPAYESLSQMADAFNPETANPNVPKDQLEMIRGLLTNPWKPATLEKVEEGEGRTQFRVLFGDESLFREMTVTEFRGVWRVIATDELLRPPAKPNATTQHPAAPSTPPAPPAPAGSK